MPYIFFNYAQKREKNDGKRVILATKFTNYHRAVLIINENELSDKTLVVVFLVFLLVTLTHLSSLVVWLLFVGIVKIGHEKNRREISF